MIDVNSVKFDEDFRLASGEQVHVNEIGVPKAERTAWTKKLVFCSLGNIHKYRPNFVGGPTEKKVRLKC